MPASVVPTRVLLVALLCLAMVTLAAPEAQTATSVSDTLSVVKDDVGATDNATITALLSATTPVVGDAVMISRDDDFADALASGLLQRNGPMFTVPTDGPIPEVIADRIAAVDPSRAIVLGGEAAVGPAVEAALEDLDLEVTRLQGGSRFDTAVAIAAAEAPDAEVIMVARAFPAEGSTDPTQAFADTLAAGGMSARNGWPVLLTQTEVLTGPTRDYIAASGASRVVVLGGTAAIAESVVDELEGLVDRVDRVAGATRFDTAVALEKLDGADDASDVSQVILVEGTGTNAFTRAATAARQAGTGPDAWAAGFAAANRAFVFDAPILLTASGTLPGPTATFLAPGVGGDASVAPLITCTMSGPACEEGRQAAGLPPAVEVTASPGTGDVVTPGQTVRITLDQARDGVTFSGSCAAGVTAVDDLRWDVTIPSPVPEVCEVVVAGLALPGGAAQSETFTYLPGALPEGILDRRTLPGVTDICGLAFDAASATFLVAECTDNPDLRRFDIGGTDLGVLAPLPDGGSNDVDIDVITTAGTVFGTAVSAGDLLVVDGEVEAGAVVLDQQGQVVLGPVDLPEQGETVGVAWDPVADQVVELSWDTDTITRVAPDGTAASQLATADVAPGWDTFYGDIEVGCDGHLYLVSSNETGILELAPDGTMVTVHELPDSAATYRTNHAAIAIDDATGDAWLGLNNSGTVVKVPLGAGTC